ncbi:hypothetical protein LCGC14_2207000, partial [marine sediment metagenome]
EDIVTILNEYFASNDQHVKLHALSKEEMMNNNDPESDQDNNGNQSDKE